ncbi:unnamed protein product [Schistosoma spindalis]|nr:unnamed protein product [Schistosoma spindale]
MRLSGFLINNILSNALVNAVLQTWEGQIREQRQYVNNTVLVEKQVDAAIVWDPLGGNPVASLSGDMASKSSITGYFGGVACAAARKPIIQTWNFNSAVIYSFV